MRSQAQTADENARDAAPRKRVDAAGRFDRGEAAAEGLPSVSKWLQFFRVGKKGLGSESDFGVETGKW